MQKLKQLISHDPENGKWGDCYRTCIAMLMDMDPAEVPHFCDGGNVDGINECRNWLQQFNLGLFRVFYTESESFDQILYNFKVMCPGIPAVITAETERGTNHCVVVLDGEVFCDPYSGKAANTPFVGPCKGDDGNYWWVEVIAKGDNQSNNPMIVLSSPTPTEKE